MYDQAQVMEGKNQKDGDRMVGAGGKNHELEFAKNVCEVPGREKQHDPMCMKWCYTAPYPKYWGGAYRRWPSPSSAAQASPTNRCQKANKRQKADVVCHGRLQQK